MYVKKTEGSKTKYVIKGKGGQGVLFLARVVAEALLLQGIEEFSFLKEFDEGQRNGEIKITFNLPYTMKDKLLIVKEHNMIELRKLVKTLNLDNACVKKALQLVKSEAFERNWRLYKNGD